MEYKMQAREEKYIRLYKTQDLIIGEQEATKAIQRKKGMER